MKPTIETFFDKDTNTLSYLVFDRETRDAVIIDPVLDYDPASSRIMSQSLERLSAAVHRERLHVHLVLETHAHADHLSGSQFLKIRFGSKLVIGARIVEVQQAFQNVFDMPATFAVDGSQFDRLVHDGDELEAGVLRIGVIATPGHTPACVSYHIADAVFTGDALFMEDYGTGRCDFPRASAEELYASVHDKLYALPDETRVFVGHDYQPGGRELRYQTTIGISKKHNIQLGQETTRDAFLQMRHARDLTLAAPRLLYPSVQVNIDAGRLPAPHANGKQYLTIPLQTERVSWDARAWLELSAAGADGYRTVTPLQVAHVDAPCRIVDVRQPEEFGGELGHINGAELVPLATVKSVSSGWDVDEPIIVVCRSGGRSAQAARALSESGFSRVMNMQGGMLAWNQEQLPTHR